MTTHTVSFSVHGDYLTDLARTRCIEGRFDHGYKMLYEGLDGISTDQCLGILRGDFKLIGVNDLTMVKDDDQEWKAKLAYHHAGVWMYRDRYYRAYAVVTSWGSSDVVHGSKITPGSDSSHRRYDEAKIEYAGRSLFYADDPTRDIVKNLKIKGYVHDKAGTCRVLFKEVRNHPFMLVQPHHDAQTALDATLAAGRHLGERGYKFSFPPQTFDIRYDCDSDTDGAPQGTPTTSDAPDAKSAISRFGVYRNKAIDAAKVGMTPEQFDKYEEAMAGSSNFEDRVKRMNEAYALAQQARDGIAKKRLMIQAQAGSDVIPVTVGEVTYQMPRAPFEQWCLWRTDGAHLATPWVPVCPSGMKMFGDDPFHTDFLVGMGLEPEAMLEDKALHDVIYHLRGETQRAKMGFMVDVLSGRAQVNGTVFHPKPGDDIGDDAIIVIPNCGPDYLELALKAKAVITEKGGAMAHLVTVAREQEATIVRIEKARKLYPVGTRVHVDAIAGVVTLDEGKHKVLLGGSVVLI